MKTKRLITPLCISLVWSLVLIWVLSAELVWPVYAFTYTVTNTNDSGAGSLRQAILNANFSVGVHDTITFEDSVNGTIMLSSALPAISDDVTITGPGAEQLAVSGQDTYRVFTINSGVAVTITELTVQEGNASGSSEDSNGGGIWSAGDLHLDAVHILSNTASGNGGGVRVYSGTTTLSGTLVSNNTGGGNNGGGISILNTGNAVLIEAQVISNAISSATAAQGVGGGGIAVGGNLKISGGRIEHNSATANGGVIMIAAVGGGVYVYQDASSLIPGYALLNGTQIISNTTAANGDNSLASGGGVYIAGGCTATLTNTRISSNLVSANGTGAQEGGGGIGVGDLYSGGTLNASKGRIEHNDAYWGGGIYVLDGTAILSGTHIVSNTATYGGGVYIDQNTASLHINNGEIRDNEISQNGSGVYVNQGSATLTGTHVISNIAAVHGGGLYTYDSTAKLNVNGGKITDNSAGTDGGGVRIYEGSATLNGTQIISNSANDDGGGIAVSQTSAVVKITGGKITHNTSDDNGGGLQAYQGTATLSGTLVTSNTAGNRGSGVYIYQSTTTLTETRILSNEAASHGGGVYIYDSTGTLTMYGGEINNNTAGDAGGGIRIYRGNATLNKTQVMDNAAALGGGVSVDASSATLNINKGEIRDNSSRTSGGGVYVNEGSAILSGTWVISNTAGDSMVNIAYGGGVLIDLGHMTLTETHIVNNATHGSTALGGGVYIISNTATLNVSGGEISHNLADGSITGGGGVYIRRGNATLNATQIISNSASGLAFGGGLFIDEASVMLNKSYIYSNTASAGGGAAIAGSMTLSDTQIANNNAQVGSALYIGGLVTPTTAMTITGDIAQQNGIFAGSNYDLLITGYLMLVGGDFYAPVSFTLTGPFTHTAGIYHQTQIVNGSSNVEFPKDGGIILNANGQDLGSTEVALTAGATCTGIAAGEAISHCYTITPTNSTGRNASATFFYLGDERPPGYDCTRMEAHRWTGAWGTPLTLDTNYGTDGRLCGADPRSLRVTGITDFGDFALRDPQPILITVTKSVTPTTAVAYQGTVTYTVLLENRGSMSDTHVVFTDSLPTEVNFGTWIISPTNTILGNNTITWTGTVTVGHTITWAWTATHIGNYGDIVTNTAEFSGTLQAGEDNAVFVVNQAPVADAGADQHATLGDKVTLDGSNSSDPNGDSLIYGWMQTGGDTVILSDSTAQSPTFTASTTGTLTFQLTVTDTGGLSDSDTTIITVTAQPINRAPIADAGESQNANIGDVVTLDGSGSSDPDVGDSLTYGWTQTGGDAVTLSDSTAQSPTFTASTTGTLTFQLTVTDTGGLSDSDTTVVTITTQTINHAPTADAGGDQYATLSDIVTLDGSGSNDPDAGDTLTYNWTQTGGDSVTLSDSSAQAPTFTASTTDTLTFTLTVTDMGGLSDSDTTVVTVTAQAVNHAPIADAGAPQSASIGDIVTLDGSGSRDPDVEDSLTYGWMQTGGDAVTLSDSTAQAPTFTVSTSGVLTFTLTVTDTGGLSDSVTTIVTVAKYNAYLPIIIRTNP